MNNHDDFLNQVNEYSIVEREAIQILKDIAASPDSLLDWDWSNPKQSVDGKLKYRFKPHEKINNDNLENIITINGLIEMKNLFGDRWKEEFEKMVLNEMELLREFINES